MFLKSIKGLEYIPYINDQVIEREIDFIEEIIEMNGNENNSFVREYQTGTTSSFCSKIVNNRLLNNTRKNTILNIFLKFFFENMEKYWTNDKKLVMEISKFLT